MNYWYLPKDLKFRFYNKYLKILLFLKVKHNLLKNLQKFSHYYIPYNKLFNLLLNIDYNILPTFSVLLNQKNCLKDSLSCTRAQSIF